MIKKGLLGGTFDPIHYGHLYIAEEALYRLSLNSILFMPSGNPPHKTGINKTDAALRYELVKMAIRNQHKFNISNYEIESKGLSYTYKTLQYLKAAEPNTIWHFISGADCLIELESWKRVEDIFKLCTLVVFNRPGYDRSEILKQKSIIEKKYNTEILFLDVLPFDISSSAIKTMLREGRQLKHLLPDNVMNTIIELGLYKDWSEVNVES